MKVGILGETSGRVRDAFIALGHDATSFDKLQSKAPGPHILGDYFDKDLSGFDLLIMHPDCTYLCGSGIHWNKRIAGRRAKTDAAVEHVKRMWAIPAKLKALENPVGVLSTRWRKPDQIIQPYQYGADASKATCLWLEGLPLLRWTATVDPRITWRDGKPAMRWSNQTDSGQNRLGPSDDRWAERSVTFPGIAEAMASQWGAIAQNQENAA